MSLMAFVSSIIVGLIIAAVLGCLVFLADPAKIPRWVSGAINGAVFVLAGLGLQFLILALQNLVVVEGLK